MKKVLNLNEIKSYLNIDINTKAIKLQITPNQAKFILDHTNKANRRIKTDHVMKLRRDMEDGSWYNDIDYIGFNSNGVLVNGQHRLKALSEAKVSSVYLKFDFDAEQHISMDTGSNRTHNDQITIFKKSDISIMPNKFKVILMAGLKLIDPKVSLSNTELLHIWQEFHQDFKTCEENELFNLGNKVGSTVKSSFLWAYLCGVDVEKLKHIAEVLRTGITKADTDIPIIRLRDALVDLRGSSKALDIKRAEYTQQCIYNVLHGSTSNRLPANPLMHYQIDHFGLKEL